MMEGNYYKEWSTALGRDMEFKVYGSGGVPVLAFPCQGGRFYDWENNGMPDAAAWLIQNGRIQLFCADSIDHDSFLAEGLSPRRRAEMQEKYFCYITGELVPRILALNAAAKPAEEASKAADKPAKTEKAGPILWAVGADLGAYQAVNCRLRRPELFCGAIGLSGRYDVSGWLGGPEDDLPRGRPCPPQRPLCRSVGGAAGLGRQGRPCQGAVPPVRGPGPGLRRARRPRLHPGAGRCPQGGRHPRFHRDLGPGRHP